MSKHFIKRFTSTLDQLQELRVFINEICKNIKERGNEKIYIELQLAINEIFCNVVKHSYLNEIGGDIVIEGRLARRGIHITFFDQGIPFNPYKLNISNITETSQSGFGLLIVKSITDGLSYTSKKDEKDWNRLRIFKHYMPEEKNYEY